MNADGFTKDKQGPPSWFLILVLTGAVIAISFSAVFIRLTTAPALVVACYRMFFTVLLTVPPAVALSRREIFDLSLKEWMAGLASGVFLALHFYLWTISLDLTPVAHSVLLVCTHPLFVALASFLFLKERVPRAVIAGAGIALLGTAIIVGTDLTEGRAVFQGDLFALLGAVMMTGYLIIGRSLRQNRSTLVYTFLVYTAAALVLLIMVFTAGIAHYPYPRSDYLLFFALALVPTLMGHTVFNWALQKVPAVVISLLFLGEPVGAALLAWVLLGEAPPAVFFPGGVLVLAGLYLTITWGWERGNQC